MKVTEGWTWLHNSTRWHYFVDGRSLCGKWMILSNEHLRNGNDDSPDNCAACRKKLTGRAALAQEVGSE